MGDASEEDSVTAPLLSAVEDQKSYNGDVNWSGQNGIGTASEVDSPSSQHVVLPPDRFNFAYWIFYLQGIGMLLPWNFFITAKSYFIYKFQENPNIVRTTESAFAVGSTVPNLLSLAINVFLTKRVSRHVRLVSSLTVTVLCMVVTTAFVEVDTFSWTDGFFGFTIFTVFVVNVSAGISQSSFFGLGGMLGSKYTQGLMGGQGIAGIFAAAANVLVLLANSDEKTSALAYFLSAVLVLIACVIGYFTLFQLRFIKARINQLDVQVNSLEHPVNAESTSLESSTDVIGRSGTPYLSIFCQVSRMAFSVCFVFFVTLSLFPQVCSDIRSMDSKATSRWAKVFFTPVVCFLLFNVCDYLGRVAAGFVQFPSQHGPWLPALCLSRVVFIPLFALCNFQKRHSQSTVVFNHDSYPIIFMILFGLTNGYFGSLCMMYGPKFVAPEHSEVAGTIMVFFLTLGLAMGSGFSFVLITLI